MKYFFAITIIFSTIYAISELSTAVLQSANDAITLALSITGVMCLWNGVMTIAKRSGVTDFCAKLLSPLLSLIFKGINKSGNAMKAISMNVIANLFAIKSRKLNENFVTKSELGYVKTLLQKEYNEKNMDTAIIDRVNNEYFEDLGDIFVLNSNNSISIFDIESNVPICYIDSDKKCYVIAENGKEFLKNISKWKDKKELINDIKFYSSKEEAEKENEFLDIKELEKYIKGENYD